LRTPTLFFDTSSEFQITLFGPPLEDVMMNFAPSSSLDKSQLQAAPFNAMLWLTSAALLIVFSIAILLDSTSSGTPPGDLALMVVFP
jgi:hypothetical protein